METTTATLNSNESFPKRIRSVSARIFSITNISDLHHHNKRTSCQIISSSPPENNHHINTILNPSKWFPRIRCRSSSSASSTFSLVFSNTTPHNDTLYSYSDEEDYDYNHVSLEDLSSQLEELYNSAKEELAYAAESQGSIYYEGDKMTAQAAFDACTEKYDAAMHAFGESANSIKFRFRWEEDLNQLRLTLHALPPIDHSIYD
ncbi:unnamed protein product [Mucor hiemalis]